MESGEGGSDTRGDGPLSLFFLLPILLYFLPLSLRLILLVLPPLLSLQLILLVLLPLLSLQLILLVLPPLLSLQLILLVLLPLLSLQLILLLTTHTYFIPSFLIFILPLTCIPKSTVLLNFLI